VKVLQVGDVSQQIRGVTYSKQDASSVAKDGYLPILRAGNITEYGLTFDEMVYVPANKVSEKQKLKKNDVLIAASSGSIDVVGKAARSFCDFDGAFGAFCKVLRPNTSLVDPSYFAHFFQTIEYRRSVAHLAAGANINNLRNEDLEGLRISVPPLEEQKRIAAILDAADALRAKRRESIEQLDKLAQSVFIDMFGDPVTNPMGWEKYQLESFCRPRQWPTIMKTELTQDGFPVYGANGVIGFYSEYNHSQPTVLITCRGATCGTINVCEPKSYVTGNAMALDDPDPDRVDLRFLEQVLRLVNFSHVITGVAQPQITRTSLKLLSVPIPPLSFQSRFAVIAELIQKEKARLNVHSANMDELFASLQTQAFSGNL